MDLKDVCQFYGLKVSGNKDDFISRVAEHVKALETTVFDNNMINHWIDSVWNDGHGFEDVCRKNAELAYSLFSCQLFDLFSKLE